MSVFYLAHSGFAGNRAKLPDFLQKRLFGNSGEAFLFSIGSGDRGHVARCVRHFAGRLFSSASDLKYGSAHSAWFAVSSVPNLFQSAKSVDHPLACSAARSRFMGLSITSRRRKV